jgi:hypothetical protein
MQSNVLTAGLPKRLYQLIIIYQKLDVLKLLFTYGFICEVRIE